MSTETRHVLQSNELSVEVRPHEGGRIASIRSLSSGLEFLTQSHRDGTVPRPSLDAMFRDGPCAGIEECLPTVAPCGPATGGGAAPDHGDFWQLRWQVSHAEERSLTLFAEGFSRPLRFTKQLTVEENTLRVGYSVRNTGSEPQSLLYACHPLFAVDAGDHIVLPAEVTSLRLDYSRNDRLGSRGDAVAWPVPAPGVTLDEAGGPETGTADMFYTDRLSEGLCSVHRRSTGQALDVLFDTKTLPYLGIWLCYGGWPDDATDHPQYAAALEPTTSPYNGLDEAQQASAAVTLAAGTSFDFTLCFRVRKL